MARREKKNPYETQAKLGLLLAVIGGLCALTLTACVFRHFDFQEFAALYVGGSPRFFLILASFLVGGIAGAIGFFVSLNSAGQRRNRLSSLAWITFFANSAVILVTLCVFVIFVFAREKVG